MKNHIYMLLAGLSLLVGGPFACTDLEVLAPCSPDTSIIFDDSPNCSFPCERTFRVSNIENLDNARFNWTLSRNSVPVENSTESEFVGTIDMAGNYLLTVLISFEFSDCSQSLEAPFIVNGDLPVANIEATTMDCIVGNCSVKFWQENENADSWIWQLPDGSERADLDTLMLNFNEAPGEYQVRLIAENFLGTDTAEKTITVRPKTFVLRGDEVGLEEIDNVLCLQENVNGSFSAIGNNEESTYSFKVSREGDFVSGSLAEHNTLPGSYFRPIGRRCREIDGRYIVVGEVSVEGSSTDFYLAWFQSNFNTGTETGYKSSTDGIERSFSITAGLDQGFIVCGNTRRERGNTTGGQGMVFVKLDESFVRQSNEFIFSDNPGNTALDIILQGNEYVVSGIVDNLGCYFRLNADLEVVANSFNSLGAEFSSPFLVKTGSESFILIGKNGNSTVLQRFENLVGGPKITLGSTKIGAAKLLPNGDLALAGYRGSNASKEPLLLVFHRGDISTTPIIEETYLSPSAVGEFISINKAADDGFLLGGTVDSLSDRSFLLIRTNSSGKI